MRADGACFPEPHPEHKTADDAEYCPGVHPEQPELDVDLICVENKPAAQLLHAVAAVNGAYCPALHGEHEGVPGAAAYVPSAHGLHEEDPTFCAYIPDRHCAHADSLVALEVAVYRPLWQPVQTAAPEVSPNRPLRQSPQATLLEPNMPPGHAVHATEPAMDEYCPAAQSLHV